MKGLRNVDKGIIQICDLEMPECSKDTMLIKNIYSGISNGTERNVLVGGSYWSGVYPDYFSYQSVGEVVETGENIKEYKVGDIIYAGTTPGHCEYHLVREDDIVVKLPDDFDLEEAALLGMCGVGFHVAVRGGVTPMDKVLIMGAGLIGLFSMQGALAHGAEVSIADIDSSRLEYAKKLGADYIYNTSTKEGRDALEARGPYDVVFEITGAQPVMEFIFGIGINDRDGAESSSKVLGFRSRVVLCAGRQDVMYNFNEAEAKELSVLHNTHFTVDDLKCIIRLMQKGIIKIRPLITKVIPFADSVSVFETLRDAPQSMMGTVIEYSED